MSEDFANELETLAYDRLAPLLESLADAGVTAIEELALPGDEQSEL